MKKLKTLRAGILFILILFVTVPCFAQYEDRSEDWEFFIAPALWAATIDLDIKTAPVNVSGELDFFDILEKLKGTVMGEYGARKGRFSITGATVWLSLQDDIEAKVLSGSRTTEMNTVFTQMFIGYALIDTPVFDTMNLTFTPQIGPRYYKMRTTIDRLNVGGELSDSTATWWDFIVGGVLSLDVNEKVSLSIDGNAGGFDWGSSSDLTWEVAGNFDYHLSEKSTLRVGYRHLDIEKKSSSSLGPVTADLEISGPVFQYIYTF